MVTHGSRVGLAQNLLHGEEVAVATTETADIVVVGFGAAGACAAIEAARGGAEVLLLDRFSGGGRVRGNAASACCRRDLSGVPAASDGRRAGTHRDARR